MHYEASKDGLLFAVYSTFQLLKHSMVHTPALLLIIHLIFGYLKVFWTFWEKWSSQNQISQTTSATLEYLTLIL